MRVCLSRHTLIVFAVVLSRVLLCFIAQPNAPAEWAKKGILSVQILRYV